MRLTESEIYEMQEWLKIILTKQYTNKQFDKTILYTLYQIISKKEIFIEQ